MWRRIFHSAVTAYVILALAVFGGQTAIHRSDQRDIRRACVATQAEWDTFQHLINAAVHPPSQAGRPLTVEQRTALAAYQRALQESIGKRPDC
jgi:hypothetical protein